MLIVGMGYVADVMLYYSRKAEAGHTHAFDDYSNPFPSGTSGLPQMTLSKLKEKFGPLERPACYGFLVMLAMALVCRIAVTSWN